MEELTSSNEPITDERLVGMILKEERVEKGISLSQLVTDTKIRSCHLVALEQGDYRAIPGGEPYVRGFLRSYAKAVGANDELVLRRYHELRDARLTRERDAEQANQQRPSLGKTVAKTVAGGFNMTLHWLLGE